MYGNRALSFAYVILHMILAWNSCMSIPTVHISHSVHVFIILNNKWLCATPTNVCILFHLTCDVTHRLRVNMSNTNAYTQRWRMWSQTQTGQVAVCVLSVFVWLVSWQRTDCRLPASRVVTSPGLRISAKYVLFVTQQKPLKSPAAHLVPAHYSVHSPWPEYEIRNNSDVHLSFMRCVALCGCRACFLMLRIAYA